MANLKSIYQAVVGISFDDLRPPVYIKPGERLPDKASAEDIRWLLAQGLIKRVSVGPIESEDDK